MRFLLFLITACFLLLMACKEAPKEAAQTETKVLVVPEEKIPTSTFVDLENNPVELSDFKGKRVLLNFWATWCRPCIEEMPSLSEAEAALKKDNYIFLLASDQSMDKIKAFKEKKGFDFYFLKFNGVLADFKVTALPATFIYNEEGNQVNRIDGATEWNSHEVIGKLKALK